MRSHRSEQSGNFTDNHLLQGEPRSSAFIIMFLLQWGGEKSLFICQEFSAPATAGSDNFIENLWSHINTREICVFETDIRRASGVFSFQLVIRALKYKHLGWHIKNKYLKFTIASNLLNDFGEPWVSTLMISFYFNFVLHFIIFWKLMLYILQFR